MKTSRGCGKCSVSFFSAELGIAIPHTWDVWAGIVAFLRPFSHMDIPKANVRLVFAGRENMHMQPSHRLYTSQFSDGVQFFSLGIRSIRGLYGFNNIQPDSEL